jgi:hypothetical protein
VCAFACAGAIWLLINVIIAVLMLVRGHFKTRALRRLREAARRERRMRKALSLPRRPRHF